MTPYADVPVLLTVKEAARILRVTEDTIYRYIENDRLPYIQHEIKGDIRIRMDDLLLTRRASDRRADSSSASQR